VRLQTGYPVVPDAATRALARRAILAGVTVRIGTEARPWIEDGRLRGVTLGGGETLSAGHVLVAAGPWTPEVLGMDPPWPAVSRTWGVTVQVEVPTPPRHVLEEGVVHTVNDPAGIAEPLFSAITVDGTATVGSTFLAEAPRPEEMAPVLLARGESFVPGLAGAPIRDVRLCARPQSADGRPFIGPVPGVEGLSVCVGHGPWGMSTGPASAAMAVDRMTGGADRVPPELRADRVVRTA
jgi:glycine/D-amino acid oxidase-like deaminating enzyme